MLQNVIRTAVISALGAKLAKGRSPIVAALLMLLATRALAGSENKASDPSPATPGSGGGLGSLIESFRKGGFEDIIKSWIWRMPLPSSLRAGMDLLASNTDGSGVRVRPPSLLPRSLPDGQSRRTAWAL
jgi:uncharacterized protein YidB (DUF937 family)